VLGICDVHEEGRAAACSRRRSAPRLIARVIRMVRVRGVGGRPLAGDDSQFPRGLL